MPLWGYVYFLKGFNWNTPLKNLETVILNKTDKVKFNLIFVEQ